MASYDDRKIDADVERQRGTSLSKDRKPRDYQESDVPEVHGSPLRMRKDYDE